MVADNSVIEGNVLRARTWACRPKERPKDMEFNKAARGEEGHAIPLPPGLGHCTQDTREEEDTEESQPEMKRRETMATTPGSSGKNEAWGPLSQSAGDLLTVARGPQGNGETK